MKWLFAVVLSALFLIPVTSQAQVGIYVNPVAIRVSNSQADSGPFAFLGEGTKSRTFWGVNMGGYYDRYHGKSVDVGFDLRDTVVSANNARLNNFLVGVRVVAKNLSPSWRPYVQVSGGVGTSRAPHTSISVSRATYGVFAGADYRLARHIDLKVAEIGYGSLTTMSSAAIGNTTASYPSSHLLQITAGLVWRFR
ncbi:outer membrane beta-barrel protein [Edaphobacter sp. HDX4]|uniref:outer membrane beta-barrel protein n=1 Tax=Edaphobacter sp. HDX4 TaxID=2794064 RepID=UPI002FE63DB7